MDGLKCTGRLDRRWRNDPGEVRETAWLLRVSRANADGGSVEARRSGIADKLRPQHPERPERLADGGRRSMVTQTEHIEWRELDEFDVGRIRTVRRWACNRAWFRVCPRSREASLPYLERARSHTGEAAKRARERLRTLVTDVRRDVADRVVGDGQTVGGSCQSHALNGFDDAFAGQRPVNAMKVKRRKMRHRSKAVELCDAPGSARIASTTRAMRR